MAKLFSRPHLPKRLGDVLHGCSAGRVQSVGPMEVVPLLGDDLAVPLASPAQAKVSTLDYGTLRVRNDDPKRTLLLPCHAAYLVQQRAQDHALGHVGLIAPKHGYAFKTAMCVQSSQGGYIAEGDHTLAILPQPLRERALEVRHEVGYSKLWDAIGRFNASVGVAQRGHLEDFFTRFAKELDTFVAEFEPVPHQVGALIFVQGKLAGVERGPSVAWFADVWEALIRSCYGALALAEAQRDPDGSATPALRVPMNAEAAQDLDALGAALDAADDATQARAEDTLAALERAPMEATAPGQRDDAVALGGNVKRLYVRTAQTSHLVGQLVQWTGEGRARHGRVCYGSFVRRATAPSDDRGLKAAA